LAQKQHFLARTLSQWVDVLEPVRSAEEARRLGYRNRTCLHAGWNGTHWEFGLLRREWDPERSAGKRATETLIPIPECPVHSERVRRIFVFLERALPPGDRFPLVYAVVSGAFLTLVLKCREGQADLEALRSLPSNEWGRLGVDGVWLNFHSAAGKRVFGASGWKKLWGSDRAQDSDGLTYGPQSFRQLLPELYSDSLRRAAAHLAPQEGDSVIDLYCGVGASLRVWQEFGARTLGVELGSEAVECAALNAKPDNAKPGLAELLVGRCSDRIPQMQAWLESRAGGSPMGAVLAYVNPPRTGLEPEVRHWLSHGAQAQRIAYLSCSPGSLARDLEALQKSRYRVQHLAPFDFFPQTHHVETLALLCRI